MAEEALIRIENRRALLEAELERFVEIASVEFEAELIILFGSLARALESGEEVLGEWSDLDLVVVTETERPFYERIKQLIKCVQPRIGVDVPVYTPSEWKRMKSERLFVKNEVLKKGRIVYERTGQQH